VSLPHGTGKKMRVAVVDDKLILEIEKGKIDFDILISTPAMMAKLTKVAKILGPRGLMPNPKNGTITDKPAEIIKKYEGGQISFKTEAKVPVIHFTVGKISFGEKKLMDNIQTLIEAVKKENIEKVVLKSTMSPGIKISL
jgi:large subunit ribosomal protein L1